jgi:hypothetical protein
MSYETRTTKITVLPKGEPLFSEGATEIAIVDEAAGEYLEVSQCSDSHEGKIKIDIYEWPALKVAIDKMIKECRKES